MNATLSKTKFDTRIPASVGTAVAASGRQPGHDRPTVLAAHDLTKTFGGTTVVDGLSFTVRAGEVLGFLGPNGAGKSTTVGMILGLIRPTRGMVAIAGKTWPIIPSWSLTTLAPSSRTQPSTPISAVATTSARSR